MMRLPQITLLVIAVSMFLVSCSSKNEYVEVLPDTVDFNFHVRPILVQNCYLCHGPDPSSREAGLRLDTFEGATALLEEGGHAVVPGKPSRSVLIHRITHEDESMVMPPPESNNQLSKRDKAILEKWIKQGAEWKPHWAFIKPKMSESKSSASIDEFLDKTIAQNGLKKSEQASKEKLIRRVSYLLTGLPPTLDELENYLNDNSDSSYEKMVDYYLNSTGFGERWARHWMDLTRYAETKGHEFDYEIVGAYQYRDYLIRAFNNDVSYDQILKEHLAGDLINEPRINEETGVKESHLATAFFTMGEGTHSPVDIKQDEADRIDNIIDVTTKTFQGLTVACAKCHDHKFDPITAKDYYAMYGVIQSTRFSPIDAENNTEKELAVDQINAIHSYLKSIAVNQEKLEQGKIIAKISPAHSENHTVLGDFTGLDFDGWQTTGYAFGNETTLGLPVVNANTNQVVSLEQGRASSKKYSKGLFGTLRSPNFVIKDDFIGVKAKGAKSTIRIIIDNFQLIQDPIYGNLTKKVDADKWNNYTLDVSSWKGHKAYIEIVSGGYERHEYRMPKDAYIEAEYAISYSGEWPKLSSTSRKDLRNLQAKIPNYRSLKDSLQNLAKVIGDASYLYAVTEGFGIDSPIFNRGSHKDVSKDSVSRGYLSILSNNTSSDLEGSGRLEMANTMLSAENPLTSRVMVNRIWHHVFGKGLVETVDNFGLQGKLPSHPELLDYLAIKFVENDWSIKKMIRLMMTSDAFKRSTENHDVNLNKDPNNLYLASFPVRRLESEAIRDAILAVAGNLDKTMYGPPVKTHLTKFMQGRGRPSKSGPLDGAGRRSIYQEVRRNFLDPMMISFDRPMPFSTFGKRNETNVPAQSLILMNGEFVNYQAELMANSVLDQKELTTENKINWLYTKLFTRTASEEEINLAQEFLTSLKGMENDSSKEMTEVEIWKEYCHSLLNMKEFIYLL